MQLIMQDKLKDKVLTLTCTPRQLIASLQLQFNAGVPLGPACR